MALQDRHRSRLQNFAESKFLLELQISSQSAALLIPHYFDAKRCSYHCTASQATSSTVQDVRSSCESEFFFFLLLLLLLPRQVFAVLFFMVTSIGAVLLNRSLFATYKFNCPLTATSLQFGVACVILIVAYMLGRFHPSLQVLQTLNVDVKVAVTVLPVSLMFLGMVCLNNFFLMSVGVGFYAIGKSLAIPFSVFLSYLWLRVGSSKMTILACCVISAGVFVSTVFDVEINVQGVILGALSSFFTAGYQIAVKRGLESLSGDQWKLSYYNSIWVVVILTPISLFFEYDMVKNALYHGGEVAWPLVVVLVLTGVVGFLIGQATYMSIHYTSALAHHVTGAVKSCLQTAFGILIWGEPATIPGVGGLLLTLLGSYMFMTSRMEPPKPLPVREAEV
jgi:GDP-fucose transporter C1